MTTTQPKQRKAVVPPKKVTKNMSLLDYLRNCQPPVDQKIIDIACSQSQVPPVLRPDAGQEISLMWSQMKPDTAKYKPGQIAAYAHRMAGHAALRLRRELGSAVRLPGSAFRKRKDGSSYVTPGVLAAALDCNEMENWFQTDDFEAAPNASAMSQESAFSTQPLEDEIVSDEDSDVAIKNERLQLLKANKDILTQRQFEILTALVDGAAYDDIMQEQGIKKGVLMREITIASSVMGPLDF